LRERRERDVMNGEIRDAAECCPVDSSEAWRAARREARERDRQAIADAHGVLGLPLLGGSDIMTDVLGLPDGSQPYVMTVGAVLLLRYLLIHAIIRRERGDS
jgi:hypothetical protein